MIPALVLVRMIHIHRLIFSSVSTPRARFGYPVLGYGHLR
jgi:hypothetical protein